jgi:putative DNA primase/helicase
MPNKKEKLVLQLSELSEEPLDWLWPGWITAGKPTLIDGAPSLGKSLLTLDLAAA